MRICAVGKRGINGLGGTDGVRHEIRTGRSGGLGMARVLQTGSDSEVDDDIAVCEWTR